MNEMQKKVVREAIKWAETHLKEAKDSLEYHRSKVDWYTNRVATYEKEKEALLSHMGPESV